MKTEEIFDLIKTRRSTRKYTDKPIERCKLEKIIEAGRYAPSGGNNQTTHFIVVTNKEILDELAVLAAAEFSKMDVTPGMYKSLASSINQAKNGGYNFHRNCAALIITANRKEYGNAMADCVCAVENMLIMANGLDIGSCYINQLKWLNDDPVIVDYLEKLGLLENEIVMAAAAFGYSDTPDGLPLRNPLERTGNKVTYIE